jgi:Protein-L-isoaspartate(D-aspartate) O-methyltransferase (PCMT)
VTVLYADGRSLPEHLGQFDAIIVTGAHTHIEPSWIQALLPGGRIVFNLKMYLAMVMIEAKKEGQGFVGNVCSYTGAFMSLHDGNGGEPFSLPYEKLQIIASIDARHTLFGSLGTLFFLQLSFPSLSYQKYKTKTGGSIYVVKELKTERAVHLSSDKIRGDISLWEELSAAYTQFEGLQKPPQKEFTVTIDTQENMVFRYKDILFPYRIAK